MGNKEINRRELLQRGALGGLGLASMGPLSGLVGGASSALAAAGGIDPMIVSAAKKEGKLNVITIPLADWADYGEIMKLFQARYGIKITDANPDGSSADEVAAIKNFKGQNRGPDVVDVGPVYAVSGKTDGLYVPYKVANWSTIPATMKDPNGYWYGDYYGAIAFMSNNSIVKQAPKDWSGPAQPNPAQRGGPGRQPGDCRRGFRCRLCRGAGQRRLARQHSARHRLLRSS